MRIEVKNIGKIDHADVKINGLTVLVGSNSTGKSTISKSLYTLIRGFHNFDVSLQNEKNRRMCRCIKNWIKKMYEKTIRVVRNSEKISGNGESFGLIDELRKIQNRFRISYNTLNDDILEKINIDSKEEFITAARKLFELDYVEKFLQDNFSSAYNEVEEVIETLDEIYDDILVSIEDDTVMRQVIMNIIAECMEGNMSSQFNLKEASGIYLYKQHESELYLSLERKNSDDLDGQLEVHDNNVDENIVYIQPMHILDDNDDEFLLSESDLSIFQLLRDQLEKEKGTKEVEDIDLSISILKKIENIMQEEDVFDNEPVGEVRTEKNHFVNRIMYKDSQLDNAISFNNVASGIKNIVIIKRLVSNIVLKMGSFLVFDEPEVNLHPDWQLKFAKILVMLQKELKLKILINTHSPYFMRALECYCDYYEVMDNLNIYHMEHSENNINQYCTRNITDEENGVAELYQELSRPFIKLQEMLEKKYGEDE